jgi:hypothetical protein
MEKKFNVAPREIIGHATPVDEATTIIGRPKKTEPKADKIVTFYLTAEGREKLQAYAKSQNRTVSQVVRTMVENEGLITPTMI